MRTPAGLLRIHAGEPKQVKIGSAVHAIFLVLIQIICCVGVSAAATPSITSLTPPSAAATAVVTIKGTGFGASQGTSAVTFNGTPATPSTWANTSIKVTVPAGATTGSVVVTVSNVASNGVNFTVLPTPTITSLTPGSDPVGAVVTIAGSGFGAVQSASSVVFNNNKTASPTFWSDTSIQVPVPTGATTGNVVVKANGVTSNGLSFTVLPTPNITSLTPASGAVTAVVTIKGTNFGTSQGSSTVTFDGALATPTTWANTSIKVTVPSGATTGPLVVTVTGVASNGSSFSVLPTPTITSLTPTSGPVGALITIAGSGFGAVQGVSSVVFNNNKTASPTFWSDTSIQVHVPTGATTGNVVVKASGATSNGLNFTVLPVPNITSLTPLSGAVGTVVTIIGKNFGSTRGTSTVTFNGTAATPTTWSGTSIKVPVPAGATAGYVVVTVNGVPSNGVAFLVPGTTPTISSLSPISGAVGSQVSINGSFFNPTQGDSTVTFNGTLATAIVSWSSNLIVATVPVGATTGTVVVTVSGFASNGAPFTVNTALPLNTSRYQHSATLLPNGRLLVAGGVTCPTPGSCRYLSSAESYDPVSGTTSSTGSLAIPRAAPAVLLTNGKVLIAGGSTCDSYRNCFSLNSAEIYDPTFGTFTSAGTLQSARDGHTMTLLSDGRVLIAGGESCIPGGGGGGSENLGDPNWGGAHLTYANFTPVTESITCSAQSSAEIYDPQSGSFTLTGSLSQGRYNAAASRLADGRVLVIGGSNEFSPLPSAEIFDPSTATFTPTSASLGTARSSPAATLLNSGLVLVTGGSTCESATCPNSTAELYDPATDAFRYTSGNLNQPRVSHTALLLTNGQVLLAGGTTTTNTELYDPAADAFAASQPLSAARSGHTATLLGNGSILLAGGIANGATIASVEIYQPATLSPNGLVSIRVTPATGSVLIGGTQQFVATGTFSDNSTSTLQSVVWTSSNTAMATISSAAGNSGVALGVALGASTITATTGTVSGSASLNVQPPVESGGFTTTTGAIGASFYSQTATRLNTGQVLITGGVSTSGVVNGARIYTPTTQTFATTGAMNVARWQHTATLLNDGTVLISGGSDLTDQETLDTAEIYNPATGTFTLLLNTLNVARVGHTATLLGNGQVLLVGGYDPQFGLIADAEIYDPPTQTFIDLGDANATRYRHTATMLQTGQVLIAGGETDVTPSGAYSTAELFDPSSQTFTSVPAPMTTEREGHSAVLLSNGQVLIVGGNNPGSGSLNTAELYDPAFNFFLPLASIMSTPRISPALTLLNGGRVLVTGGASGPSGTTLSSAEIYDPTGQTFSVAGSMASARQYHTDTLLSDGTVLIAGGTDGTNISNIAELYTASQLSGLTSIAVIPGTPSVGLGAQQLFTAVGTFSDGSTASLASVLWSSSNTNVSAISNDATNPGVVSSLTQGSAILTASAPGINGSATLTITAPTLVLIQISPQNSTIPLGSTQQFTATGVYTDGSTQDLTGSATWSSAASVVTTINSSGVAAGLFEGMTTIQISFGALSAVTNLTVGQPALVSINVTPTSASIAVGTTQQYQATGTYSDGTTHDVTGLVAWDSSATNIATISETGLASSLAQGTTSVTATFGSISVSVPLTVGTASLASLIVTPNAANLSVGATQQLTATGTYSDSTTQNLTSSSSWISSNPGVLSVTSSGLVTAGSAGQVTVTATSGTTSGTAVLIVTSSTTQTSLNSSRYLHSATLLHSGKILIVGGVSCASAGSCSYLNSAEIYDPNTGVFTNTGVMSQARSAPAVLLNNGNVLIAGGYTCDDQGDCSSLSGAEVYNPSTGSFTSAGSMTTARSGHTMTPLPNGTVLIAGGQTCASATSCTALATAEIYDPVAGTFTPTLNGMSAYRYGASAVTLNSGLVLIVGGFDGTNLLAASDLYDPTQHYFVGGAPQLNTPRFGATATLLNNGQVLVVGGSTCALPGCPTNAAEIFDPTAYTFTTVTGGTTVARFMHTATLLTNGQVAVAGGFSSCDTSCTSGASVELYDPIAGMFSGGPALASALAGQTGTLIANGNVLLIGGISAGSTLAADGWYQPTSLTPAGLVSIAVTPAASFLVPAQSQQMVATGTFTDSSTQVLQSVTWTSSNPSAAIISNSPGNAGVVTGQAQGAATITATAGTIGGSASLSVAALVSLTVTPANPTLFIGTGQQFTATGNYSDGSTQNLTTSVLWSSDSSNIIIDTVAGLQGLAMGITVGTANVTATLASVSASTFVTVQPAVTPVVPSITSLSPSSGVSGTQVNVSGSGFGATQGSGTVYLGTSYASVVSWSDSQIVATVSPIASSGFARVQQGGLRSNTLPFTVNNATIYSVLPTIAAPGAQVLISGSGFGIQQGSSQVFLGTVAAVVQSWSDSQIEAEVAVSAKSGSAGVLENGVFSNSVPFTVNRLQVTSVSPNSGAAGTVVTLTGSGFGASQGGSVVWLGTATAEVMNWSDTRILAIVSPTATSGFARVQQNGVFSNALVFTVPGGGGQTVTLVPNMLSMVVGDTRTLQAFDANGQVVTGLSWVTSDPHVVSLSTDDPPVLTALAPGRVTILTGNASADITVYPLTVPVGTILWSSPGDGTGVMNVVPAVPSETGVADVFALDGSCNVQALQNDGSVAWTYNVGQWPPFSSNLTPCSDILADFQGGMVVKNETRTQDPNGTYRYRYHVQKLDGLTGQPNPDFSLDSVWWINTNFWITFSNPWIASSSPTVVHPDGTIFTIDHVGGEDIFGFPQGNNSIDVIDPTTGVVRARVSQDASGLPFVSFGTLIVGGDGYAYVPYTTGTYPSRQPVCPVAWKVYLGVLRVGTDGSFSTTQLDSWDQYALADCSGTFVDIRGAYAITNADQGVLASWQAQTGMQSLAGWTNLVTTNKVAVTSGGSVVGKSTTDSLITPAVQAQDGSFFGTDANGNMVHLDQSANETWSVQGDSPRVATSDGGVTGASGTTYDINGHATGVVDGLAIQSWTNEMYAGSSAAVTDVSAPPTHWATSYAATIGGNPSGNGTSIGVTEMSEGLPIFALSFWGPSCKLGDQKIALGGNALQTYTDERSALLAGNYLTSTKCSEFFTTSNNPARASYFSQLTGGVTRQLPYDGILSNLSEYDAGFLSAEKLKDPNAVKIAKGAPVCGQFVAFKGAGGTGPGPRGKVTAASQIVPTGGGPATDVYVNTKVLKTLKQATVIHEALHNLTQMYDDDLEQLLGLSKDECGQSTICISNKLVTSGCAGNN